MTLLAFDDPARSVAFRPASPPISDRVLLAAGIVMLLVAAGASHLCCMLPGVDHTGPGGTICSVAHLGLERPAG